MSRIPLKRRASAPIRPEASTRVSGNRVGRLVGWSEDGTPLVDFDGNPAGPIAARVLSNLRGSVAKGAAAVGLELLLAFEEEQAESPIVVGILGDTSGRTTTLEALVDGKRVVIEGHDEIVLKCGLASITLRRNGRVVVRGTYVETRANGVNRIRGGTVEIN